MKKTTDLASALARLTFDLDDESFARFTHRAAVALILTELEAPEILFIHRAHRAGDPWSGHIALPGGRMSSGDLSLKDTAKRETLEEVGLDLDLSEYLGVLTRMQLRKLGSPIDFGLECHIFYMESKPALTLDPREVRSAFWVPERELFSSRNFRQQEFHFEKISRMLPALEIDQRIIWGLTYMILSHYQQILAGELDSLPPYPL